jgi:hypothetical protein
VTDSNKCSGGECGCPTKKPKKGNKLDTQMFPECEGTKYDRDIVKKTVEKRKRKAFNLKDYRLAKRQEG